MIPNGHLCWVQRQRVEQRFGRNCLIIFFAAVVLTPNSTLCFVRIFGKLGASYFFLSGIFTIFEYFILFIAIFRCFHIISYQCQPIERPSSYDVGDCLLVVSSIVTTGYVTLNLIIQAIPLYSTHHSVLFMVQDAIRIIYYYLQTVFILQMRKFRICSLVSDMYSVRHVCLFIGVVNLGYWMIDTFLIAQYGFKLKNQIPNFDLNLTGMSWAPAFIIFYRFECFVCFYALYKV